jgi:hypothetical protein
MTDEPTASPDHDDLVVRFFGDFDEAFASFDGTVIAARYLAPYTACRSDGSAEVFGDADAIGDYFQRVVDGYHDAGVRSCRHHGLEVSMADGVHTLARVTWVLEGDDARPVRSWSESYLLIRRGDRLFARASVDHPADDADASE